MFDFHFSGQIMAFNDIYLLIFKFKFVLIYKLNIYIFLDVVIMNLPILDEAIVVVIVWKLDLQLPMQSVHITTNVVSSNPTQARCT
jgi:hypothetical protein